jgi:hypothetical protein
MITRGDMPSPMPTKEVARLDMFSFGKKKKQVVRKTHKKRILIVDQELVVNT